MKKKPKRDTIDVVVDVFSEYPGSQLIEYLKDGACIQATVEDRCFSLEKVNGILEICEEEMDSADFAVVLNRAALDYLAGSEELEDFVTRTRECLHGKRDECEMTYEVIASPPRMLLKGYLEFARKMGLL